MPHAFPRRPRTRERAAAPRGRPWRISPWSSARGGAAPGRSPPATRPALSISVAAVCRSRCAPTRGSPARVHASRTIEPIVLRFSPWRGAVIRKNSARHSHRGRRRQIGHDRLTDIDRQRQLVMTAALAANEQQPAAPVDVIEREPRRPRRRAAQAARATAGSRSRAGRPAVRRSQTGQELLDRRRLQAPRQCAIAQIRDRRDRPHQRRLDQPRQMQVAQKRPQRAHQIPRASHAALRALARQEQCSRPPRTAAPVRARPGPPAVP